MYVFEHNVTQPTASLISVYLLVATGGHSGLLVVAAAVTVSNH